MPAATRVSIRHEIVNRREAGERFSDIAHDLRMPYATVRNVYAHYKKTGDVKPAYDRCCHTSVRKPQAVYERAIELKTANPRWGGGLIWVQLTKEFEEETLPSVRTLQRWFKQGGLGPAPRDKARQPYVKRGKAVHEVWAIDAKEEIRLQDGSYVCWLVVSDEASSAILYSRLFPPQTLDEG